MNVNTNINSILDNYPSRVSIPESRGVGKKESQNKIESTIAGHKIFHLAITSLNKWGAGANCGH